MMHIQKIVLHPKLENEHRQEVIDWFSFQLPGGQGESWWLKSNYDTHGCFNVTLVGEKNIPVASAFMLVYPDTLIIEKQYHETYEIAPEALALFEFEG